MKLDSGFIYTFSLQSRNVWIVGELITTKENRRKSQINEKKVVSLEKHGNTFFYNYNNLLGIMYPPYYGAFIIFFYLKKVLFYS